MIDPAAVAAALLSRCETLEVGSPVLPVAFPDVPFDPAVEAPDGRYLTVDLFNNAPFWEGLTSGRIDQGLMQITVVWPKGEGLAARRAAAEVIAQFPKNLTLPGSGVRVKINRETWQASPILDDDSTSIPVTISWVATAL